MSVVSPRGGPFVGCRRALNVLGDVLEAARRGRGGAVLVTGEAGIGKSRLVREFVSAQPAATIRLAEGRCVSLGIEPLRHAALLDIVRDAERGTPAATTLAGLSTEGLLERLLGVVGAAAPDAPLVIVVEDVHWADRGTSDAAMVLASHVRSHPSMLVLTYRDDEVPAAHPVRRLVAELRHARLVTEVPLRRLSAADSAQLIDHLTGGVAAVQAAAIYAQAAGNPLLIEELCAATPHVGAAPSWAGAGLDVLRARFDRLSAGAKQVAGAIAVAGAAVDLLQLDDVADRLGWRSYQAALHEALDGHLLVRERDRVDYHHRLVADAVYHNLLPAERRRIHAAWANALRLSAPAGTLAHHWVGADEPRHALAASVSAGDAAAAELAFHESLHHYRQALRLWADVADAAAAAGGTFVEISRRAAESANRCGSRDGALAIVTTARHAEEASGDPVAPCLLAERAGWYLLRSGRVAEADAAYSEAIALLPADAPPEVAVAVMAGSVRSAERRGDVDVALMRARAAIVAADAPSTQAHAHYMHGRALMLAGLDVAAEEFARAATAAEQSLDLVTHATALLDRADLLATTGTLDVVIAEADAAAHRLRAAGRADPNATFVAAIAALLDLRRGCVSAAQGRAIEITRDAKSQMTVALARLVNGWCHHESGAHDNAREHLEMVRILAAPLLDWRLGGVLALLRAELLDDCGLIEEARRAVDEGVHTLLTTGDDELLGHLALCGLHLVRRRERCADQRVTKAVKHQLHADRERYASIAAGVVGSHPNRPALAAIRTELDALGTPSDPASWLSVAIRWSAVQWPRFAVRARLDAAIAFLGTGDRRAAADELARVTDEAGQIESGRLAAAAATVANRAGLAAVAAPPPEPAGDDQRLTQREREVLDYLATGATNRQIANALFISDKTASVHVSRILTKLDAHSRTEAATLARQMGLARPL